jgi:adenylosuccinate synthase
MAITKLDRLDGLDEIKICVAYDKQGGKMVTKIVPSADELEKCKPVYHTFEGWKTSTKGITKYSELPENAKKYIKGIEGLVGVPVTMIGTGPERDQIIIKN